MAMVCVVDVSKELTVSIVSAQVNKTVFLLPSRVDLKMEQQVPFQTSTTLSTSVRCKKMPKEDQYQQNLSTLCRRS